jgi:hypothetical protein
MTRVIEEMVVLSKLSKGEGFTIEGFVYETLNTLRNFSVFCVKFA